MQRTTLVTPVIVLLSLSLKAQTAATLFRTIAALDSTFFVAFNTCDLDTYGSFLSEDYEFYHDKQGMTPSREAELAAMQVFCGEQRERQRLERVLIKESLEVFPMHDYGALATGEHQFYLLIDEHTRKSVSKAKFTTLWQLVDNEWKMTRTMSYDHQPAPKYTLTKSALQQFEGDYQAPDRIVNIRMDGNILRMTDIIDNEAVWQADLLPESEQLFYLNFQDIQVEFILTGNKATKFVVYENGQAIETASRME